MIFDRHLAEKAMGSDSPIFSRTFDERSHGLSHRVVLINLRRADTLAEVEPFLVNLFSDRDIIELLGPRVQPLFARLIAKLRGPAVRRNYASIGGGSPQLRLTREQAGALEARLNRQGDRVRVAIAMRYWQPSTEEALRVLAAEGVERIVTLTLYPPLLEGDHGVLRA